LLNDDDDGENDEDYDDTAVAAGTATTDRPVPSSNELPQREANDANGKEQVPPRNDARNVRLSSFFRLRPWVLVPDGSFNGYFDYLPLKWRVGTWNPVAVLYLVMVASAVVFLPWVVTTARPSQRDKDEFDISNNHLPLGFYAYLESLWEVDYGRWDEDENNDRQRRDALYNAVAFLYMAGIGMHLKRSSPLGIKIWSTYTIQSWTVLAFRHLCCALSCLLPPSSSNSSKIGTLRRHVSVLAEIVRFPAACSATVTFVVWNALVMPFIYLKFQHDPERRRGFLRFCFSFRLVNVHILNIVLAYWNALQASPPRLIGIWDFYWALVSVALYMAFYLLVLDRLGVHLYAVFSPRAPARVVLTTWTLLLGVYVATFFAWQQAMKPIPTTLPASATQRKYE
jgi:hypothetical protein